MTALAFHQPIDRIALTLSAHAQRLPPPSSLDLSPNTERLTAEIASWPSLSPHAPHHYLGPSPRIAEDAAIAAFARDTAIPA